MRNAPDHSEAFGYEARRTTRFPKMVFLHLIGIFWSTLSLLATWGCSERVVVPTSLVLISTSHSWQNAQHSPERAVSKSVASHSSRVASQAMMETTLASLLVHFGVKTACRVRTHCQIIQLKEYSFIFLMGSLVASLQGACCYEDTL